MTSPTLHRNTGKINLALSTDQSPFSDVAGSFASSAITLLASHHIVHGYSDGTFRPNNPITRAEFLAIVIRSVPPCIDTGSTDPNPFADVSEAWQIPLATEAYHLGMISGYTDDNGDRFFHPDDPITRAEALKILLRATGVKTGSSTTSSFTDVGTDWQIPVVESAYTLGIVSGQTDASGARFFRPNDSITRAEAAKIVVRASKQSSVQQAMNVSTDTATE